MHLKNFGPLLVALIACAPAFADGDDVPADVAAKIRTTLHQRIPELTIEGIHKGPIPGLYGVGNCVASASAQAYWAGGATLGPIIALAYRAARAANAEPVRPSPVAATPS